MPANLCLMGRVVSEEEVLKWRCIADFRSQELKRDVPCFL